MTNIKSVLNDFETIANGIEAGILDERFYFNQFRGAVISDYKATKSFIEGIRNRGQNKQFYVKFESLAQKWEKIEPGTFPQLTWRDRLWGDGC